MIANMTDDDIFKAAKGIRRQVLKLSGKIGSHQVQN